MNPLKKLNIFAEEGHTKLLFLVLFCLFSIILFPTSWSGNEENYFQLSYRTVVPVDVFENSAVFDTSKGRLVSEHIIGNLVKYTGYETAHKIVRILAILGYAISLSLLFGKLNVGTIDSILIVSVFILTGQQLFGGEWLFAGGESKVFAYILVFLATYCYLDGRHVATLLWLIAATYFHFLVGLFWTVFIFTAIFFHQRNTVKLLQYALFFTASALPLLALIISEFFIHSDIIADFSADYIYTRIRNPHHIDPFNSLYSFLASWSIGIAKLGVIFAFSLQALKKNGENRLGSLIAFTSLYLFLFLIISFFDRNTLLLGKFYLFRPTALVLFFFIILVIQEVKENLVSKTAYNFIVLFCIITAILPIAKNKASQVLDPTPRYATQDMLNTIEEHTKEEDIVLLDLKNSSSSKSIGLVRDLNRPTLAEWKFIPTQRVDILRWRNLMTMKVNLFNSGCDTQETTYKYFIVFSKDRYRNFSKCSEILYQDSHLIFFTSNFPLAKNKVSGLPDQKVKHGDDGA